MSPGNDERRPRQGGESSSSLARPAQDDTDVALQHVAAVVARVPEAAAYDLEQWLDAIRAHLQPLPANRQWRVKRARHQVLPVKVLAPSVARRLTPEPGRWPQPTCPEFCREQHQEAA